MLPAFFDVTITNTNSPVQEGDILTVDYSADNTGDAHDTQDIRLEIDSVEEDRDSDITLLGAESTTGTLEWDTTDEDEAEYTATVLSDDDTDSVTVEIGTAIPDSAVYRWEASEGSGQTLTDSIQEEGISLNFDNWVSGSQYVEGEAVDYDGTDDYGITGGSLPELDKSNDFSIEIWLEINDTSGQIITNNTGDAANNVAISIDQDDSSRIAAGVDFDGDQPAGDFTGLSELFQAVLTWDSGTETAGLYLNATEQTEQGDTDHTTGDDEFVIGSEDGSSKFSDITHDLIQIHDETLSGSQIQDLYDDHPST